LDARGHIRGHSRNGGLMKRVFLAPVVYVAMALGMLSGALWLSRHFGTTDATTLVAALGGALVGALAPVVTAALTSLEQQRSTDERIRDEASRVALELTRMDYDLRQRALREGQSQQFLAPAKVYREFYRAVVELRIQGTWPQAVEAQSLLNIFTFTAQPPNPADPSRV